MKQKWIAFVMLYAGCADSLKPDDVKDSIPGIYVRHYRDEFTDSYDTIEIFLLSKTGSDSYGIVKKMKYQKVLNDHNLPEQYKVLDWTGSYDRESKSLLVMPSGKRVYFNPSKRELQLGRAPYKKLK